MCRSDIGGQKGRVAERYAVVGWARDIGCCRDEALENAIACFKRPLQLLFGNIPWGFSVFLFGNRHTRQPCLKIEYFRYEDGVTRCETGSA